MPTTTKHLPVPPRRASSNTTLVRDTCPFEERSLLLATGIEGSILVIDQLAASIVGVRGGGSMARKGVHFACHKTASVTTQYRRFAEGCHASSSSSGIAGKREGIGGAGDDRPKPVVWRWSLDMT